MNELAGLLVDGLQNVRIRAADVQDADAGEQVDVGVAVDVADGRALPSTNAIGMSSGYATALLSISRCFRRSSLVFGPDTLSMSGASCQWSSSIGRPAVMPDTV